MICERALQSTCDVTIVGRATWLEVESVQNKNKKREQMLLTIQDEEMVSIMRARQILEMNNEYVEQPQRKFPTQFVCEMTKESKRKFTPWLLEKCLEKILTEKPILIRSKSNTTFTQDI